MNQTILRVDASSRTDTSYSRRIGDAVEKVLRERSPGARVLRRDLTATPPEHIQNPTIAAFYTPVEQMTSELKAAATLSDTIIAEVRAADLLLITTPMYNFSIPSALKAWIDQLVRIGHTFSYDGKSFAGLLSGRKAIVVVAYGAGGYLNNGALTAADFVKPYLTFLFNFLGIADVTFIPLEGTTGNSDDVGRAVSDLKNTVPMLVGTTVPLAGTTARSELAQERQHSRSFLARLFAGVSSHPRSA
jgi:FMN-dependent NADH-azoreductase